MKFSKKSFTHFLAGIALLTAGAQLQAAEVEPGTILSKANIDQLKDQTLSGHKISSLLTEKMEMMVREKNLKLKLTPTTQVKLSKNWLDADKNHGGTATLDSATNEISNYQGGVPFHNISESDPKAGWKLAWNHYYANPVIADSWVANAEIYITEADSGEVDHFGGLNARWRAKGRINGDPIVGKENDHSRYLLVLTTPYDIAGLGVFNKQYDDGSMDDSWVYVKSVRRTRRSAGGKSWMDPQPKMDFLNDDNQGSLGYPAWFPNWEVVEKRHILAVVDSIDPNSEYKLEDALEMEPPYWNPNPKTQSWSPREVYVVKGTMPDEHPYGHKILYMDTQFPTYYMSEMYDKKGDFWRIWRQSYAQVHNDVTGNEIYFLNTQAIDFQRDRATYIMIDFAVNNRFDESFFKPAALKKAASGKLVKEIKKF